MNVSLINSLISTILAYSVVFSFMLNAQQPSKDDIPMNFCDLSLIYNPSFTFSLPETMMKDFLSGKAFGRTVEYTDEEKLQLQNDINTIGNNIFSSLPTREKVAVMTAGAPGAGKTIKMKQELESYRQAGKNYAYICPDDVCLKQMNTTFLAGNETGLEAYNKWRPGSNAAAHLILANLIREGAAFFFGTTSTSPATHFFFNFLKKQDYRIKLIHISAPDNVRWESIKERDKSFVQTTEEDIIQKGKMLPERINDTYLKFADEIEFCYRDGVDQDAVLAARWIRTGDAREMSGSLEIVDHERYDKIKTIHNVAIEALNKPELSWENTVELSSSFK